MERITIDPHVRSGKPTIRGTRITVSDILEYLAGGMSPEEILADFPDLRDEDIRAALAFVAQREHREELDRRLVDLVQYPDAGSTWEEVRVSLLRQA